MSKQNKLSTYVEVNKSRMYLFKHPNSKRVKFNYTSRIRLYSTVFNENAYLTIYFSCKLVIVKRSFVNNRKPILIKDGLIVRIIKYKKNLVLRIIHF